MKKVIKNILIFVLCVLILNSNALYATAKTLEEKYDNGYYYSDMIKLSKTKEYIKNRKLKKTYIAVFDSGLPKEYVNNVQKKVKACITDKSWGPDFYTEYSQSNLHGYNVQYIIDDILNYILGLKSDTIQTIHYKMLNEQGKSTVYRFADCVNYVLNFNKTNKDGKIAVVNFSSQFPTNLKKDEADLFTKSVKLLYDNNVSLVVCSGNEGGNIKDYNYISSLGKYAIIVGGINMDENRLLTIKDKVIISSNYGSSVDIVAPAWEINVGYYNYENGKIEYIYGNGTSFSAPQVTAAIALMKSINSKLKPSDIEKILQDTAKDLGKQKKNRNDIFGYGLLNTYSAIEKAYKKNK